jgi:hypothetical protein
MQDTVFAHIIKLVLVTLSAHAAWDNGTDLNVRTICYDGLIPLHAALGGAIDSGDDGARRCAMRSRWSNKRGIFFALLVCWLLPRSGGKRVGL